MTNGQKKKSVKVRSRVVASFFCLTDESQSTSLLTETLNARPVSRVTEERRNAMGNDHPVQTVPRWAGDVNTTMPLNQGKLQ